MEELNELRDLINKNTLLIEENNQLILKLIELEGKDESTKANKKIQG